MSIVFFATLCILLNNVITHTSSQEYILIPPADAQYVDAAKGVILNLSNPAHITEQLNQTVRIIEQLQQTNISKKNKTKLVNQALNIVTPITLMPQNIDSNCQLCTTRNDGLVETWNPVWTAQCEALKLKAQLLEINHDYRQAITENINTLFTAYLNDNSGLFPAEDTVIKNLATLLRKKGNISFAKKLVAQRFENKKDVEYTMEQLYLYAHQIGSKDGTYLWAQNRLENKQFAHAIKLFNGLPSKQFPDAPIHIAVCNWLNKTTFSQEELTEQDQQLIAAFQNEQTRFALVQLITIHSNDDNLKEFWQLMFNKNKNHLKFHAALQMSILETNTQKSDIYLTMAAQSGNQDACQRAFDIAKKLAENSEMVDRRQKLIKAAAQGGHAEAQLHHGLWAKIMHEQHAQTDPKQAQDMFELAKQMLQKSTQNGNDCARVELAILPHKLEHRIKNLHAIIKENDCTEMVRAQYWLAKTYNEFATCAKINGQQKLYLARRKHALEWYAIAAQSQDIPARIVYACELYVEALQNKKVQKKHLEHARQIITKVLKRDPNNADARLALTTYYLIKNDFLHAIEQLAQAHNDNPDNDEVTEKMNDLICEIRATQPLDFFKKTIERALSKDKKYSQLWIELGSIYRKQKNVTEVTRCYNKAGELGNPIGYCNIAVMYINEELTKQNFKKALLFAQKTLEIDPLYDDALTMAASIYEELGEYKKAKKYWLKSVENNSAFGTREMAERMRKGIWGNANIIETCKSYKKACDIYQLEAQQLLTQGIAKLKKLNEKELVKQAQIELNNKYKKTMAKAHECRHLAEILLLQSPIQLNSENPLNKFKEKKETINQFIKNMNRIIF
ncbi:MAG: hypothetical protein WD055_05635 [Candidatus Dependentiae bacterium]